MTDSVPHASLRDPLHQVSTKAPVLWAAAAVLWMLVLLVALVVVAVFDWWDVPLWVWPLYAVLAIGYVVVMPMIFSGPAADAVVTVTEASPSSRSSGPCSKSTVCTRDIGAIRRSRESHPVCV